MNIDLSQVIWLHRDVSRWPATSHITKVTISPGRICVYHTKAGKWKLSRMGDINVEGNIWVFAEFRDQWYAATWDWLRAGQECKDMTREELGIDQIRIPPMNYTWVPKEGERVGFMMSTRARDHVLAGEERSDVLLTRWPAPNEEVVAHGVDIHDEVYAIPSRPPEPDEPSVPKVPVPLLDPTVTHESCNTDDSRLEVPGPVREPPVPVVVSESPDELPTQVDRIFRYVSNVFRWLLRSIS
jgi:hypothetical protein